jgi:hypothetical protein
MLKKHFSLLKEVLDTYLLYPKNLVIIKPPCNRGSTRLSKHLV